MKPVAYATRPTWWDEVRVGAQCYDDGHYWQAHEHWERAWKAHLSLNRHYLKGLIQFTAVCYHLQRGRLSAARRLLDLGPSHLFENHPLSWPFDTAHLLTVAAAMSAGLDRGHRVIPPTLGLVRMMDSWAQEHWA